MQAADEELLRRAQARVGATVNGKWTIDRLIGLGGMAAVYAVTHRNRKRAALKMLLPELSVDPATRQRFLREGYVANSIQHPGAVRVDDDDVSEDGAAYLVMELLEGETVDARFRRKGNCLPVHEVLSIADKLLDVLVAAHEVGVVHRDLKPENLFLTLNRELKVLDFGIARVREFGPGAHATQAGAFMGTPAFMAPEQARGRWDEVDERTDLWAVGSTMYLLLTGHPVHEAETANEVLGLAMSQRARPISQIMPELPSAVAEIVDQALAYAKSDRFPSAAAMQNSVRLAYHSIPPLVAASICPPIVSSGSSSTTNSQPEPSQVGRKSTAPGTKEKPLAQAASTSEGMAAPVGDVGAASQRPRPARRFAVAAIVTLGIAALAIVGIWAHRIQPKDPLVGALSRHSKPQASYSSGAATASSIRIGKQEPAPHTVQSSSPRKGDSIPVIPQEQLAVVPATPNLASKPPMVSASTRPLATARAPHSPASSSPVVRTPVVSKPPSAWRPRVQRSR